MTTYRLNEVIESFDTLRKPLSKQQRSKRKGDYQYYGAQGVIDYIDNYIFDGEFLLIAEDGENLKSRKANIAQLAKGRFWVNNHAHIIKGNSLCNTHYLCYLLNSLDISGYITGSAQPKLNQENLNSISIQLPPLIIQNKVALLLDTFEDKIATNTQINRNLEGQTRLLYQNMLLDCSKQMAKVNLSDIAKIDTQVFNPERNSGTKVEYYSIPAFDESHFPVFENAANIKSSKFFVDKDSLLISKLNPTTKRIWRPYCLSKLAVCSTEFIVYHAKNQQLKDFLYAILDSDSFSAYLCSHVSGSTGSRQRAIPSDTLKFPILLPKDEELTNFTEKIKPIYSAICDNELQNHVLIALRNTILPKLMSGEIDVSEVGLSH